MKRPISLWIFGITGVVANISSGIIFFLMFYMSARAFFWSKFIIITLLLLLMLIITAIGLFSLKRWGRNIFSVFTIIINSSIIVLLSRLMVFPVINIVLIVFLICFVVYFLKPSTRRLFDR